MKSLMTLFRKYFTNILLWLVQWFFYGKPPAEKEAYRKWLLKNLDNRMLPVVQYTEFTWDDDLLAIVRLVVMNDSQWDVAWDMFQRGDIIPDGVSDGTETGLLMRIRTAVSKIRFGRENVEFSSDAEAESISLAVMILSVIANGPLALKNVKALIERIKNRRSE